MKEYLFKVKVIDKRIGIEVELPLQKWTDRSEAVAKDLLRLSTQIDFKDTHGHWPEKVELVCINGDIGNYEEDK